MNATNPNALRLDRIRTASYFLKRVVWAYICLMTTGVIVGSWMLARPTPGNKFGLLDQKYASWSEVPLSMWLLLAAALFLTVFGLAAFYRLLSLYERGVIFSPANAAQFHRLGVAAIGFGVLGICMNILNKGGGIDIFGILFSPWIYGGIFLLIVAWIMEEGSKIQEEQELTV